MIPYWKQDYNGHSHEQSKYNIHCMQAKCSS
jgi:hypothetical protein